jgi:dihydrofolate reductase
VRKLIVSEFMSLDGVIEDPSWTYQFTGKEQQKFKFDELSASDALLLGRVTYEGFATALPRMIEQAGELSASDALLLGRYADKMNGYPKYVASTTLQEPLEWNNSTLIGGDVAEEVSRLKEQPGKDISIFGSGQLVNTLMRYDLIDEYRLMIFPIIVGSGRRLFADGIGEMVLELVDTETFGSGVVVLTYRPAGEQDAGQSS